MVWLDINHEHQYNISCIQQSSNKISEAQGSVVKYDAWYVTILFWSVMLFIIAAECLLAVVLWFWNLICVFILGRVAVDFRSRNSNQITI